MAEETGGGYFELKDTDDLGPTFTRVAQELHSQYLLGFEPQTDGKVHKIEVRVTRPGLVARGRRSYQAPRRSGRGLRRAGVTLDAYAYAVPDLSRVGAERQPGRRTGRAGRCRRRP